MILKIVKLAEIQKVDICDGKLIKNTKLNICNGKITKNSGGWVDGC